MLRLFKRKKKPKLPRRTAEVQRSLQLFKQASREHELADMKEQELRAQAEEQRKKTKLLNKTLPQLTQ